MNNNFNFFKGFRRSVSAYRMGVPGISGRCHKMHRTGLLCQLVRVFFVSLLTFSSAIAADFTNWPYRLKLTLQGYKGTETLTNVPMLVVLNEDIHGFTYDQFTNQPSVDLRFTGSNELVELNYEIEEWSTSGDSYIWVQIPELSGTNTYIWACWGSTNPVAPAYTTNGDVWSDGFIGVWHLNDDTKNSTSNSLDGVNTGSVNGPGMAADAQWFDDNDYIRTGGGVNIVNTSFTVSAWAKRMTTGLDDYVVSHGDSTTSSHALHFGFRSNNQFTFAFWSDDLNAGNYTDSDWHYWVGRYESGIKNQKLYRDAVQVGNRTSGNDYLGAASSAFRIGERLGSAFFNGGIDEVRVESVVRSTDWINATWANMVSNEGFWASQPLVSDETAGSILATSADMNGYLWSTGAVPFTAWVYYGRTDGGSDADAWEATNCLGVVGEGVLSTNITGLIPNSTYYYRYYVSNTLRQVWAAEPGIFINGTVALQAVDDIASEVGSDTATFEVYRDILFTNSALTVNYTAGGTAINGLDYVTLSGSVEIPAGATNAMITITAFEDAGFETNETVILTLAAGGYLPDVQSNDVATIIDTVNFLDNWPYVMKISFPGYSMPGTLTNYPALVVLNESIKDFRYNQFVAGARELRFVNSNTTAMLNYEIEKWDTNGNSYIWVRVPELVGTNTFIYACWGNTNALQLPYTTNGATWSEGYMGVWHLDETSGSHEDSSPYLRKSELIIVTGQGTASGISGGADDFDGVDDYVDLPDMGFKSHVTVECWASLKLTPTTGQHGLVSSDPWSAGICHFKVDDLLNLNADLNGGGGLDSGNGTLPVNQWFHAAYTVNSNGVNNFKAYLNGGLEGQGNGYGANDLRDVNIARENGGRYLNAKMDEVRISSVARSVDWLWATWMNIGSNSTFVSYEPLVKGDDASNISIPTADLNGYLSATGAVPFEAWVYYGESDGGIVAEDWEMTNYVGPVSLGNFFSNVGGLSADKTYYYRFFVSNSVFQAWSLEPALFVTAELTLDSVDTNAVEGTTDRGMFRVYRGPTLTNSDMTVYYSVGGAASSGVDYAVLDGSVVIPAGATNADVYVTALEDGVFDDGETLVVSLLPGGYLVGTPSNAVVAFTDIISLKDDWDNKMKITFSGYDRPETLTNFPAHVVFGSDIPGFTYELFAFTDGTDLRFMNSNETEMLSYEIEEWDTNGNSYVWVRVPELVDTNSYIWAVWGNTNSIAPPYLTNGTTWSEGYRGVWHLAQDFNDSSAYRNDGIAAGSPTNSSGVIYDGDGFDGNDYLNTGAGIPDCPANLTESVWVKMTDSGRRPILAKRHAGGYPWPTFMVDGGKAIISVDDDGYRNDITSATSVNDDNWHYITGVKSGTTYSIYVDGLHESTEVDARAMVGTGNLHIGHHGSWNGWYSGMLDEVRVSDVARSSNWVWACYMNQSTGSFFNVYSRPENKFRPQVDDAAIRDITYGSVTFDATLYSTGSAPAVVTVYWGTSDGGTDPGAWAQYVDFPTNTSVPYAYSTNISGLTSNVYYYSRCAASNVNGTNWTRQTLKFITGDVSIQTADSSASETWPDNALFLVRRPSTAKNEILVVDFTVGGTAIDGLDYANIGNSVTLPIGVAMTTISILPVDDALMEAEETVSIAFHPGEYVLGSSSNAEAVIHDNDSIAGTKYKMKIDFPGYNRDEPLTNFPALVVLNESLDTFQYDSFTSINGYDLLFANADESIVLNHEIEEWNTNGNSYVWVQVPVLVSNTWIWACWHNSNIVSAAAYTTNGSTWDSNYKGVWHMTEPNAEDSTSMRSDGASVGNTNAAGVISGAQGFNNTFMMIPNEAPFDIQDSITVSAWVRVDGGWATNWQAFVSKDGEGQGWQLRRYNIANYGTFTTRGTTGGSDPTGMVSIVDGEWHHIQGVYNGTRKYMYVDGIVDIDIAATGAITLDDEVVRIGARLNGDIRHRGLIDEVCIADCARSSNWVWACWMNQGTNHMSFTSYGVRRVWPSVFMLR